MAELIGSISIPLGAAKVVLLPMIWALIIGAILGTASYKTSSAWSLTRGRQVIASHILQPALLIFIAKLGVVVGGSLPVIAKAGWALAFQELGHFVGTVLLAMPVALLLGIKREAIGATFSVGREPSLAIIGEKYGMSSAEGRGVLAEYLTGTLFGALFIAIVAGFITSLNIFDPRSLAMASGVGSGSMMAAAAGAIAAQVDKQTAETVMALAAASNLLTTTFGTYFTLFISLPLAITAYRVLEPILGKRSKRSTVEQANDEDALQSVKESSGRLSWSDKVIAWFATAILSSVANWIAFGHFSSAVIAGCLIMILISLMGDIVYKLTRGKIPTVCWVSVIAMYATSPWCPWAKEIAELTGSINMLSIITPMLTFAGLSIAKDLPAFRKLGWRIVVVSFVANFGTFIGAALIAEFFH
ncbi:DUF3100 domain-containing protein [Affinibrenneria salicis]|uniref:DUF3100 domain-containing protein n=1 Tax=Affinibrenneria salicis TaxID=2590031 RepID=UPI0021E01C23|nr:DUF3100 domain-containing protein [Affinibrenneria salicis]